ncbi:hypothetical protein CDES_03390 [Corynebacterium deserti GIMN1.010]|uniref:Secreted protein n=1 Tax=Corynebacterium deserti GIMN1.010 TaxID=931089 RepID=A0A0M5INZ3_9CORY|nr:hypothetical protein [Corynebacterium deserti]ALC05131.1 hypothetical protein CDES_03390 [Corynebacterium deserti GIMN1.010]
MRLSKIFPALVAISVISTPIAGAATLEADTSQEKCVATNTDDSAVVHFWDSLEDDVREQRLDELDAQDPGIKAAIESYIAQDSGAPTSAELQTRLDNIQSGEGLAMLIPEDSTDPALVDPNATEQFKTEYTYDEAVSIANSITDDSAASVLTQLQEAAEASTRTAEIRAEKFAERTDDYNQTQQALKADFQACIDTIDDARPIPTQYLILGGAIAVAIIALGARAWSNSRKTSKHGA